MCNKDDNKSCCISEILSVINVLQRKDRGIAMNELRFKMTKKWLNTKKCTNY